MKRSLTLFPVATAVLCALCAGAALGNGGTAVPFFCGKTYVLGQAVPDGNALAGEAGVVVVTTVHFLDVVKATSFAGCSPAGAQLSMSALLECKEGSGSGPTLFGPFPIAEGFSEVLIDVPVPSGPPRVCDLILTATVTFSDGSAVQQETVQPVSVVEAVAGRSIAGALPRLGISCWSPGGSAVLCGHAGSELPAILTIANNDPVETASCVVTVTAANVADLPLVTSGVNDTAIGAFALADPGGGDAHLVFFDQHMLGCIDLPAAPHELFESMISTVIVVPPGATRDVALRARSHPLDRHGTCSQGTARVDCLYTDGSTACATAGFVNAVDRAKPADLSCPFNGRAATVTVDAIPGFGPAVRCNGDASASDAEDWRVNFGVQISTIEMTIDGVPISGGTPSFSGVTQIDGQYGRLVTELSFISPLAPPAAVIGFAYTIRVAADNSTPNPIATEILSLRLVQGAPNGYADMHPFLVGDVRVNSLNGIDDAMLSFVHQFSAIGVEQGDFSQVATEMVSLSLTQLSAIDYRVESTWKAPVPGDSPMIGFDVANGFHSIARPPTGACSLPGDDCLALTATLCADAGGAYQGDGSKCPPPQTQACCFADGSCQDMDPEACLGMNGAPGGPGTSCGGFGPVCTPPGACCLNDGSCVVASSATACAELFGGVFRGPGTNCETSPCVPGDLDGDGLVHGADLGLLLSGWGPCPLQGPCVADLNGDGVVDGADLGLLLGGWTG